MLGSRFCIAKSMISFRCCMVTASCKTRRASGRSSAVMAKAAAKSFGPCTSWDEALLPARALGIMLQSHEVQGPKDFAAAFSMIAEERPDALLVLQDAVTMQQRNEIIDFARQKRLPSMFQEKGWAVAGGLMSYGENLPSMYRRAAYFVDRIFHGVKPADLPVEQATKFDMILNLRTAKAIGLTIPDSILVLADEVIE